MACEISAIGDFLFGSIRTNLPMETVDVELTVQMVKGIYTYGKDHIMDSMIFTPWSKKVTPFPSLRSKIQAYQDDKRSERVLPWNNGNIFQFSAPPMMQNNPKKRSPGKIKARWSNKSRYNPMKAKRPNTLEMTMNNLDAIDTDKKVPLSAKVSNRFGLFCSFCNWNVLHPHPRSQTGQMKIGLGHIKVHIKGRLTYYQIGTCPNPNLNPIKVRGRQIIHRWATLRTEQSKRGTDQSYWLINTATHNEQRRGESYNRRNNGSGDKIPTGRREVHATAEDLCTPT